AVEDMLARTDSAYAPWTILPATDKRYTHVAVLQAMLATLEARLGNSTALRADQRDSAFDASGVLFRRAADAAHTGDMERTDGAAVARTVPLRVHAALRTPPAASVYTAAGILHRVDLSQKL